MTFIRAQLHTSTEQEEDHNDMTPEMLLLASVSLAATYISAGGDPSLVAICGAMLAALVALLKAAQEKRDWTEKAINSVGVSIIGSTVPAPLFHYFWPEAKLTWHLYMIGGFLLGLCGWPFAYAFVKVFGLRSEKFANRKWTQWEKNAGVGQGDSSDGKDGRDGRR